MARKLKAKATQPPAKPKTPPVDGDDMRPPKRAKRRKATLKPEWLDVDPAILTAHPRNYRKHSDRQLDHIIESLKTFGVYRNIVVARNNVILAGHGVVLACLKMKMKLIPIVKIDVDKDEPRALKLLAGDNEIGRLGEVMDRELTEILRDIHSVDDLLGTGFDEKMLANMVMVTRSADEILDTDEAAEWLGMPNYDSTSERRGRPELIVVFLDQKLRDEFVKKNGLTIRRVTNRERTWTAYLPHEDEHDMSSVAFKDEANK